LEIMKEKVNSDLLALNIKFLIKINELRTKTQISKVKLKK